VKREHDTLRTVYRTYRTVYRKSHRVRLARCATGSEFEFPYMLLIYNGNSMMACTKRVRPSSGIEFARRRTKRIRSPIRMYDNTYSQSEYDAQYAGYSSSSEDFIMV